MKRKRNDITLEYLKSLEWEIHKIDDDGNENTATCEIFFNNTSCPLGQGLFWIDLEYTKENYIFNSRFDTPLMFTHDYDDNDEDIFLFENEYHELIQHIKDRSNFIST